MQKVDYPALVSPERSMVGIFTIENTAHDYDTIFLGDASGIALGYVTQDFSDLFVFTPATEVENPFPARGSYAELWQDILTLIANDLDLAIELTIKVNQKVVGDD